MNKQQQTAQEKYSDFTEDQRQFFDELITREWDTYNNPLWDATRQFEVDRLFERISPKRILDVGCGCGYHDVLMAEKAGVEEVVGLDYSEKSIETANKAYPNAKVTRRVGDIFSMDAGTFDLVISFQVIEHLKDPEAFLKACARQVRPGGWVTVVTPNRLRFANRLRRLLNKKPKMCDPQHFREYLFGEIENMGSSIGLTPILYFAYGASIRMPGTNWRILPHRMALRIGFAFPSISDCFCVVFLKSEKND